jgi:aspartyl-tRNA(Asn)/glutamyl-tRNA(Gln) amidotransferase subunit A
LVPTNIVLDDCEPAVQANFGASLERLAHAGARIEHVAVPAFDEIGRLSRTHGTILAAEAHAAHRSRLEDGSVSRMDRRVVSRLEAGSRITLADYLAVVFARRRLIEETDALLADGFIAFPTAPIVAPTIASVANDDDRFFAANAKILRNTSLGNVLGWCGVSLPNGVDGDGMPTALLLSAAGGRDDALLALAQGCETIVRGE